MRFPFSVWASQRILPLLGTCFDVFIDCVVDVRTRLGSAVIFYILSICGFLYGSLSALEDDSLMRVRAPLNLCCIRISI